MLLAIFVAISLIILSLSYFRMMRATRNTDTRLSQQFVAREIALMLREETMASIQQACKDSHSQIFWFLLGAVSGAQMEMRLPLAGENISRLLLPGFSCEFSSKLKVVDFINHDHRNRPYASAKEGHGIIAIVIEVTLLDERAKSKSTTIREKLQSHHDYLIASTLSPVRQGSRLRQPLLLRFDRQVFDSYSSLQIEEFNQPPSTEEKKPEEFKLYEHTTLWRTRNLRPIDLEQLQVIDKANKRLNLHGIYHCNGTIDLPGDWLICGKGVIVADSFTISGALKKSGNEDIIVLYARKGKIVVETENKIEAVLVAINDSHNGTIEAKKALDLNGALVADYLNLNNWSNNTHHIAFDQALLRVDESYQISVSPWVNFRSGVRN